MMKEVKGNVPKLRFGEFVKEWEQRKLGSVTYKISVKNRESIKYPIYSINNKKGFIPQSDQFEGMDSNDRGYDISLYKIIKENTFAYNPARINVGSIGYSGELKNIIISSLYICFKTIDVIDDVYLLHHMNTNLFNKSVLRNVEGGVRLYLFYDNFSKIIIKFPSLFEQRRIASFLTVIDQKIQQLSQKKSLLENYKKGMMQQIFSQQFRFKDEDGKAFGDWEEKFAHDIFKSHSNKNHNGELPILAITQDRGTIYRDDLGMEIQSSEASVKSYKIIEKGDFIISLRSFQGGIEYSNIKGICSPAYTILKPILPISDNFYKYYLKKERFIKRLSNTVVGIRDGKQISYSAFSGLKLVYPTLPEQQKIAAFLTSLDEKINKVAEQLSETEKYKKGLLQQMFV